MVSVKNLNRRNLCMAWVALIFCLCSSVAHAQLYRKSWELLNRNERKAAREQFLQALESPATAVDAAFTLMYLETFESKDEEGRVYFDKIRKQLTDANPYLYALWFNPAMAGDYGQKSKQQEKFLQELLKDPNTHPMFKAAAHYQLGHHEMTEGEFEDALEHWAQISNVTNWQFTGPFDNVSESGFDKVWPPISQPEPTAQFKATNNADIRWFTPATNDNDGWVTPTQHVRWSTGVVYGQSFVTAPADMDVVLSLGFSGSLKAWVNDRLLFVEQEERKTELDVYKIPCKLEKGVNRVLIQLSYVGNNYPNYLARFTDQSGNLVQGLTSSGKYQPYPKDNSTGETTPPPFWAETFFEKKLKNDPKNLLNHILLCQTYLRANKAKEALETIEAALAIAPDNTMLRFERIQCYLKLENRTALTEDVEFIKANDPESWIGLNFRYTEERDNEKYDEAEKLLKRRIELYGVDEGVYEERIKLAAEQEKMDDLLRWIDEAYREYPRQPYFAKMKHEVALRLRKNPTEAMGIYESFLKRNYHVGTAQTLANEYFEFGLNSKGIRILEELDEIYPTDPDYAASLFNYYYGQKENKKAKIWVDKLLGMAPFHSDYWDYAAKLAEQSGSKDEALRNFQKALHYDPNDYDARARIRDLQGKAELVTLFPKNDPYELLRKTKTDDKVGEHDWYYVLDEQCTILYPERTSETYYTIAIKILNEKGIDTWKETTLGYNSSRSRLIIEKAEVVKASGSKVVAEQNGNELVFPNLEKGDGVYIRYRVVSYSFGRMAREFWDTWHFNTFVPTDVTRFCLLAPKSLSIDFKATNCDLKPTVKDSGVDGFQLYTWESANEPAMKDERFTPSKVDVGKMLHLSTLPNWGEVTTWFGDISATQAKRDYEVKKVARELFPEGKTFTETEKARKIYEWVVKNIRYSSVPFRQSGYVPQRAAKVIQTKLGDCKDLATLYAALAREVGLKANLVLIDTRDNGRNDMVLPSMEFNHCIVKVVADGTAWFLELTSSDLPFGSLPNVDYKAIALEIPFEGNGQNAAEAKPFFLDPPNRIPDFRHATTTVDLQKRDLVVSVQGVRGGNLTSSMRDTYSKLPRAKRIEEIQRSIGGNFTNPVTVKELHFGDLEGLTDTLHFKVTYNVKNEVVEIGELQTFKVPYYSVFVKAGAFPEEERTHPLSFWEYEDTDEYREEITVNLPAGKAFTDLPKDVSAKFEGIATYSLKFMKKAPGKLVVLREIKVKRDKDIPAADYTRWRDFVDEVVGAESKFVAFK